MINKSQKQKGFTLVEILVVISVIGILGGITYSTINVGTQKAKAEDAKKRANISSLAEVLDAYRTVEGLAPLASSSEPGQNPLLGEDSSKVREYLTKWPDADGAVYVYRNYGPDFAVYVRRSSDSNRYFKYSSAWGEIRDCGHEAGGQAIGSLNHCFQQQ